MIELSSRRLKIFFLASLLTAVACSDGGGDEDDTTLPPPPMTRQTQATCVAAGQKYDGSLPCCESAAPVKLSEDEWQCFSWDASKRGENEWSADGKPPYQTCPTINGSGKANEKGTSCLCNEGYVFNTQVNQCQPSTPDAAPCPDGTYSGTGFDNDGAGGGCTPCTMEGATGNSNASHTACEVMEGYEWNGTTVVVLQSCDASQWSVNGFIPCVSCPMDHGTGTSTDDRKSCQCNEGFIFNAAGSTCDAVDNDPEDAVVPEEPEEEDTAGQGESAQQQAGWIMTIVNDILFNKKQEESP